MISGSLSSQIDTYVLDARSTSEIQFDFEEQAKIISPYVDFFYLDVVSSGREIEIASNIVEKKKNSKNPGFMTKSLSLIHISRCRRLLTCRTRWSPNQ